MKLCKSGQHWKPLSQFKSDFTKTECLTCQSCRIDANNYKRRKREENPTAWKEKRKIENQKFSARISFYKSRAKKKAMLWALTKEQAVTLFTQPCFYCGSETPNSGIDRVANDCFYTWQNSVACCGQCNTMKLSWGQETFVKLCGSIVGLTHRPTDLEDNVNPKNVTFEIYKRSAEKYRSLAFTLDRLTFQTVTQSPCTYCGKKSTNQHRNGIDRIDSSLGYEPQNVQSCCSTCNRLKFSYSEANFLEKCKTIYQNCAHYFQ